jgi:hypothetical protein
VENVKKRSELTRNVILPLCIMVITGQVLRVKFTVNFRFRLSMCCNKVFLVGKERGFISAETFSSVAAKYMMPT